ncbi:TRAP transporter small permease [bacterium]|nr:TRAP transporter small permease [bacterium]
MSSFRLLTQLGKKLISVWALVGGLILLSVVSLNIGTIIGGIVLIHVPGDFELTQIGVAVAVFCFLPYCQLHKHNVTADIFTFWANNKTILLLRIGGAAVALLFSILLLWRMTDGMLDQKKYDYTTAILQFPVWIAFIPILISLWLLGIASIMTIILELSSDSDNVTSNDYGHRS